MNAPNFRTNVLLKLKLYAGEGGTPQESFSMSNGLNRVCKKMTSENYELALTSPLTPQRAVFAFSRHLEWHRNMDGHF